MYDIHIHTMVGVVNYINVEGRAIGGVGGRIVVCKYYMLYWEGLGVSGCRGVGVSGLGVRG